MTTDSAFMMPSEVCKTDSRVSGLKISCRNNGPLCVASSMADRRAATVSRVHFCRAGWWLVAWILVDDLTRSVIEK